MHRSLITLCIFLFGFSTAFAQEIEIFIPDEQTNQMDQMPTAAPDDPLAQCFASGDTTACENVKLNSPDSELESFVDGGVPLETFFVQFDPDHDENGRQAREAKPAPKTVALRAIGIHIEFKFDSDVVRKDQIKKLDMIGNALNNPINSSFAFAILGHTDGVGSEIYNCDLSDRRAYKVARELRSRGVIITLVPIGVGEELLKDKDDPENDINRRVSFINLGDYPEQKTHAFQAYCG